MPFKPEKLRPIKTSAPLHSMAWNQRPPKSVLFFSPTSSALRKHSSTAKVYANDFNYIVYTVKKLWRPNAKQISSSYFSFMYLLIAIISVQQRIATFVVCKQ